MYYQFLEPFIREHFMLGPFRRKHTYLSMPIEGLGLYRVANITTDLPRSVNHNPLPSCISYPLHHLPQNNMGFVPLIEEDIEIGQVQISRSFNDCYFGVEVWEFLRSGASQMYRYEKDRLVWVEHWFDQLAKRAVYQDFSRFVMEEDLELPAPAYTYFRWDREGRLTDIEWEARGLIIDWADPHRRVAKIEYQHDGDLVILTLKESLREPEQKYAWLFEDYLNKEIIQELALQEPGIQLARTRMSRAEYESQTSVHRLRYR